MQSLSKELLLDNLRSSKILHGVFEFFRDFNSLYLYLFDQNGNNVSFLSDQKGPAQEIPCALGAQCKSRNKLCIPSEYLDPATPPQKPIKFYCKEGAINVLVPVLLEQRVVGYLFLGENQSHRLTREQADSMSRFLEEIVNQVVAQEVKLLNYFKGSKLSHQKKILHKVMRFIVDNYNAPDLSLTSVAQQNNISYHYLSHLFGQESNTTFSGFLNRIRIEMASQLLKDKSLPVGEVSYSCGFQDSGYFSKVFKKVHGVSPVEYRDQFLNNSRGPSKKKMQDILKQHMKRAVS